MGSLELYLWCINMAWMSWSRARQETYANTKEDAWSHKIVIPAYFMHLLVAPRHLDTRLLASEYALVQPLFSTLENKDATVFPIGNVEVPFVVQIDTRRKP